MLQLIESLFGLNRTIVTSDNLKCVAEIARRYPITTHRYPTGSDYQTWIVPPEWNVVRASVTNGETTIASYEESPLFLAPYSCSFTGWVDRSELVAHTMTNPAQPECFSYEFRLAYDFRRRLSEWRITMPHDRLSQLPEGRYFVDIEVETQPGELLVAEQSVAGASGYWFALLSHYCHVGQANDGIAGVVAVMEAVRRAREKFPSPRHGYLALAMPETIGSSIYVASHLEKVDNMLGATFTEMAAADAPVQMVTSRRGNTYIDRVFLAVLKSRGLLPARVVPFRKGWGNDELVLDSPGVGVPSVSLDRYPFDRYHTSQDDMSRVDPVRLEEMVGLLVDVISLLERDFIPVPVNRVPVYQTRYQLYSDWTMERSRYDLNAKLIDEMWSGKSALDIALSNAIDPELAFDYIGKFAKIGLVREEPVTPDYTRRMLFLPAEGTN